MLFQCGPTVSIPAPETSDNTIHWHNADVMLGHRLRANIIPTKTLQTLNHTYNRGTLGKDKSTQPEDLKRYIAHVHKDWCKCEPFPTHSTPLSPKKGERGNWDIMIYLTLSIQYMGRSGVGLIEVGLRHTLGLSTEGTLVTWDLFELTYVSLITSFYIQYLF